MAIFSQAQIAQLTRLQKTLAGVGGDVASVAGDVASVAGDVASVTNDLGSTQNTLSALVAALTTLVVPTGLVACFAGTEAPAGWLVCDGSDVSREDFADLFSSLGEVYGPGDGSTTFTLPDLRGEFVRGADEGRGVDNLREIGTWQDGATAAPNSTSPTRLLNDGSEVNLAAGWPDTARGFARVSTGPGEPSAHSTVGGTTVDFTANEPDLFYVAPGDEETRPRNVALLYCIKT